MEHGGSKEGERSARNMDLHAAQDVHPDEGNAVGILQNDLREPDLTGVKDKARNFVLHENADAVVIVRVMEGTANARAVGTVGRLPVPVVDEEACLVGSEAAVDKDVVAAVVDTAV